MADLDPSGSQNPEPILMKLGMVDCVRDPTPHDNFGGGRATWVVWAWLVTSLSFFSFFFCFLQRALRSHWPIGTIYTPKRVFPTNSCATQLNCCRFLPVERVDIFEDTLAWW